MPREISFVDYVCQNIENYDLNRCNLQVVLPSMRLKREIEQKLKARAGNSQQFPFWMPVFTTMSQIIGQVSGLNIAHPAELTAILYQAYQEAYQGKAPKSFDLFWDWGQMLLSDFNQIDNQLAPAKEILQYMAEEKRMGQWNLDLGSYQGELQGRYLEFYSKLWDIYTCFTNRLIEEGHGYTGLCARKAVEYMKGAEDGQDGPVSRLLYNQPSNLYLFAGFNALTKAEETLIRILIKNKKAEILWNVDRYYMDERSHQEAGLFFRRYLKDDLLNHHLKDDDICDRIRHTLYTPVACAQNIGQVKILGEILQKEENPENTLIVLNDENLMPAVMNSIPGHLRANISIASSPAGTLASALFQTLMEARESVLRHKSKHLHSSYLIRLLRNRLFTLSYNHRDSQNKKASLPSKGTSLANELISCLIESKQVYFQAEEIKRMLSDFPFSENYITFIFGTESTQPAKETPSNNTPKNLLHTAYLICTDLLHNIEESRLFQPECRYALEDVFLEGLIQTLPVLEEIIDRYVDLGFGENSQMKLLQSEINAIGIHYLGDPNNSINIMGVLETRGMEAGHIIMLSTNEGFIPTAHNNQSFLLHSIKEHYSLPTPTEQTAMQAYHFYSLLQGCRKATFLYVESVSDTNSEKSRFLLQLENELPGQMAPQAPTYPFPLYDSRYDQHYDLSVEKTPKLIKDIQKSISKISFSALSTYLNCPMRYYRERILKWGEPPVPSDEMDPAIKGEIFHKALENFFCGEGPDQINRMQVILHPKDVELLRKHSRALVEQATAQKFPGGDYSHGGNYIAFQEILLWMERYAKAMEKEISQGELRLLQCEAPLSINFERAYEDQSIQLLGFADRIDIYRKHGDKEILRIIDYKTGKLKNLKLDSWDLLKLPEGSQALQLLMYLFLYQKKYPENHYPLQACICSTRNKAEMSPLTGESIEGCPMDQLMENTAGFIRETIVDMLDPEHPIVCTRGDDNCKYCPYEEFCGPVPQEMKDE